MVGVASEAFFSGRVSVGSPVCAFADSAPGSVVTRSRGGVASAFLETLRDLLVRDLFVFTSVNSSGTLCATTSWSSDSSSAHALDEATVGKSLGGATIEFFSMSAVTRTGRPGPAFDIEYVVSVAVRTDAEVHACAPFRIEFRRIQARFVY